MTSFVCVVAALMCQTAQAAPAFQDDSAAMLQHSHASSVDVIPHTPNGDATNGPMVAAMLTVSRTSCGPGGGLNVASIGCPMDHKVMGLKNGANWTEGCLQCGESLQDDQGLISGCPWYCEQSGGMGIWLKSVKGASASCGTGLAIIGATTCPMDKQVMGMFSHWMENCQSCGANLEKKGLIGACGWWCEQSLLNTGVWLKSSKGSIPCGNGLTVASTGCGMNNQVIGIAGSSGEWMNGCQSCAKTLQDDNGQIGGCNWWCQGDPTGVWLKSSAGVCQESGANFDAGSGPMMVADADTSMKTCDLNNEVLNIVGDWPQGCNQCGNYLAKANKKKMNAKRNKIGDCRWWCEQPAVGSMYLKSSQYVCESSGLTGMMVKNVSVNMDEQVFNILKGQNDKIPWFTGCYSCAKFLAIESWQFPIHDGFAWCQKDGVGGWLGTNGINLHALPWSQFPKWLVTTMPIVLLQMVCSFCT